MAARRQQCLQDEKLPLTLESYLISSVFDRQSRLAGACEALADDKETIGAMR